MVHNKDVGDRYMICGKGVHCNYYVSNKDVGDM